MKYFFIKNLLVAGLVITGIPQIAEATHAQRLLRGAGVVRRVFGNPKAILPPSQISLACTANSRSLFSTISKDQTNTLKHVNTLINSHFNLPRNERLKINDDEQQRIVSESAFENILVDLQSGNDRYVKGISTFRHMDLKSRKTLAKGQNPEVVVVSCSDSRVVPEFIFDKGPGDLFTVRNAGHCVGKMASASIEYAVSKLGAKVIVVMGHESCGAVQAAATHPIEVKSAGSENLDAMIRAIKPHLLKRDFHADVCENYSFKDEALNNSDGTLQQLMHNPILRNKVNSGELHIVSAYYHLESGKVDFTEAPAQPLLSEESTLASSGT